jgi:predicted small secreted protein
MVSGFNTEVEFEGTLFHIQTEVRKEADIETTVYVKGAVVHSLKTSHPGLSTAQDGDGQQFTLLLEDQHRQVIDQVRAGEIRLPSVATQVSDPLGES